ncbi:uncharacterized protein LOC108683211 [Hyalella azteca]|uniref:Uncharacterized protein LOC108683211 n=1 Tax=Hyalella azteca TaxID=294128 RepID=A0A8B7PP65_HYAAZ|nr:uncharacterized protein LOC108683211 [Hyalella azteca]
MVEAMPAMLTNFVRNVRQFENNKQIAYLAELVEKRLGTYRPLPFVGAEVPTPMLTYQRDEQAPPDEDEVVEMSLRLKVVGLLMPVIVDYLDVAKHFYDPIFRT